MTISAWLKSANNQLAGAGITSSGLDSELILGHVLKLSREEILAHPEKTLPHAKLIQADKLLTARLERKPLVHLTGEREFFGLNFEITPDVLTPRVETEVMVEAVIELAPKGGRLLDVGTGSGAIAIACQNHRPDLSVTATDVSPGALNTAHRNAKRHGASVKFIQSDLFDDISGRFDIITANLPYLRNDAELMPEVKHEPAVALLGGNDGLDLYRRFFGQVMKHSLPGGLVLIEADPWQHPNLVTIAQTSCLTVLKDDYFILTFKNS